MEKRAKLILAVSFIGIIILLFLVGFAFAQDNGEEEQVSEIELSEQTEEENSPQDVFLKYLQEKINELPDEEKAEFEKYQNMEPAEAFLKAIEKLQSLN